MKITRTWLTPVVTALAFGLSIVMAIAQGGGPGGGGGGMNSSGGGGAGFANMDPQKMQQWIQDMMLQNYREQLEITNDDEWSVIKDRVVKITTLQQEAGLGSLGGLANMFAGRGGRGAGGPGAGRGGMGGISNLLSATQMPERDALQKALDAKASPDQLKDILEKYRAAVKAREEKLATARNDLRGLLSRRQEVAAVLAGLLD